MGKVLSRAGSSCCDKDNSRSKQTQQTDAPRYHNMQEIIDTEKPNDYTDEPEKSVDELKQLVHKGIYLAEKTKKYWVDAEGRNCFKLFPKGLNICWSEDPTYWTWEHFKDASDEFDVALLKMVSWLEIRGNLKYSYLTPNVLYQVVFEAKLEEQADGWDEPVNFMLSRLPDGAVLQNRTERLEKKGELLQLMVGEVTAQRDDMEAMLQICMFEYGGHWKKGLRLEAVNITPK